MITIGHLVRSGFPGYGQAGQKMLFVGWTVFRFWGNDIKKNVSECVRVVEETIFDAKIH